jgi:hypothetical protein
MTNPLIAQARSARAALEGLSRSASDFQQLSEAELHELSGIAASIQRHASTHAALVAGDIGRRSSHELGRDGFARRAGYRSPEEFLRSTGATAIEASRAVRVGTLVHDTQPWMQPVANALTDGSLSPAAADSIRSGLGEPTSEISSDLLADAADLLCTEATALDPDRLHKRARELRDELDEAGIADREAARRELRSLRFVKHSDGMSVLTWRLDPESAAAVGDLYDRATSPRRGGPRFGSGDNAELAERLLADRRTTEQIASDTFLELLRQGSAADSSQLLYTGAPVVRVVVAKEARDERSGHGWIEGQHDPVSIATVERLLCGGAEQIATLDDDGQPLDLEREQRLFSRRQRIALALRDGGCAWVNCDRPPSWTEAHHVEFWKRDKGKTNIANGILFCRHHHLELHNEGYDLSYCDGTYTLVPPAKRDPSRTPIILATKSRLMRELKRNQGVAR